MKVKELFTDESKWCTGAFAKDIHLTTREPESDVACMWCLLGAVRKCYPTEEHGSIYRKIHEAIDIRQHLIAEYNDSHEFKDIKKLVEELDI